MKAFCKITCINNDFESTVVQHQIGRYYSYYYKQRFNTPFLNIFAVVNCFPCFKIIGDTGELTETFRMTKVTFLNDVCRRASTFPYTLTWAHGFIYSTYVIGPVGSGTVQRCIVALVKHNSCFVVHCNS